MSTAVTLEGLWARLPVAQRERLAQIQQSPRTRGVIASLTKGSPRAASSSTSEPVTHTVTTSPGRVDVVLKGLRLVSEANAHELPHVRHRRAKVERSIVDTALASTPAPRGVTRVVITRVGKRLLDTDNLAGAAKHARDAIAAWLGVDDGPRGPVAWEVVQEIGKGYAVRIAILGGAR